MAFSRKNVIYRAFTLISAAAATLLLGSTAFAQQAQTSLPAAADTTSLLPSPNYRFQGQVGETVPDSDPASHRPTVTAPAGAPNVLVVLLDDVGFGQFGTFGGAVSTPGLDKLAAEGLRYNRFHTTAICSPTRAALLTGRNHHVAGAGGIAESATGYDGYVGVIPKRTGMVADVLRQHGYATAWLGKNHNTPPWEGDNSGIEAEVEIMRAIQRSVSNA